MNPTTQIYSELQNAYDVFNARLFDGTLPPCLITLQRRDVRSFGYYSPKRFGARTEAYKTTDEIALNPIHFKSYGPGEALQTLAHEMCHLWQQHHGTPSRQSYHNNEWADKMESIGLMPSSTGKPGGARVGQKMADYVIAGGLFESVAAELLATDFRLGWYDQIVELIRQAAMADLAAPETLGAMTALAATPAATSAKRSKVAFACSHTGCKAKAWGKQSLHIVCGEHGQRMAPAA